MTGRVATMSMDGTPISRADIARMAEEERLHAERQRSAARVVAAASIDVADCRTLLEMLGLSTEVVRSAQRPLAERPRRRSRAA